MPTTMSVTGTFDNSTGQQVTGTVQFAPNASPPHYTNGNVCVPITTATVSLVNSAIPAGYSLIRCASGFTVTELISGSTPYSYSIPDGASVNLANYR